jgi:hypothetical protein
MRAGVIRAAGFLAARVELSYAARSNYSKLQRRNRVRLFAMGVIVLGTIAMPVKAQVLDAARLNSEPRFWISGGLSWSSVSEINDGSTGSRWRFSDAAKFRATAEYSLGRGNSLGAAVSWSRVPLRYLDSTLGGSEDVTATISSMGLLFHVGGGEGLHQVIEVSAGAMRFSDFSSDETGARRPPFEPDYDFDFTLGIGFGYSLSKRVHLQLVQDFGWIVHQLSGLPNDANHTAHIRDTRFELRYGFGGGTPESARR